MGDVDRLLREFIEEQRGGGTADPVSYLAQVTGADRRELATLIDGYLARAPREPWDPQASASPVASAVIERLSRAVEGASGRWPIVLPRLRSEARLLRSDVASRLAEALGVADRRDRVAAYYHEMEQGLLPSAGVSPRVLEELGAILGATAEALRQAGASGLRGAISGSTAAASFARTAAPDDRYPEAEAPAPGGPSQPASADDVDRLFRGGD